MSGSTSGTFARGVGDGVDASGGDDGDDDGGPFGGGAFDESLGEGEGDDPGDGPDEFGGVANPGRCVRRGGWERVDRAGLERVGSSVGAGFGDGGPVAGEVGGIGSGCRLPSADWSPLPGPWSRNEPVTVVVGAQADADARVAGGVHAVIVGATQARALPRV